MKIAVLRRNGFGDLICTAPLIACLQERHPSAEITLFLEKRGVELAPFLFPQCKIISIAAGNKYVNTLKTAFFGRNSFDLAIAAKTTPMKLNDFFLKILNAPVSMAVSSRRFLSHPRAPETEGHQALRCLKIFDPGVGAIAKEWVPKLIVPEGPQILELPRPILLFSLSNRRATSQLHWKRFAEIANRLPFSILINSVAPHPDAILLKDNLKNPSQILATPNTPDFLRAVAASDCVLTGDGGLCHIAAALGKPQVALYACTPLDLWHPLSPPGIPAYSLFDFNDVNQIHPDKICELLFEIKVICRN